MAESINLRIARDIMDFEIIDDQHYRVGFERPDGSASYLDALIPNYDQEISSAFQAVEKILSMPPEKYDIGPWLDMHCEIRIAKARFDGSNLYDEDKYFIAETLPKAICLAALDWWEKHGKKP